MIRCFNSTADEAVFWNGTSPGNGIEAKGNFTSPNGEDPDVAAFWAQEPEVDRLLGAVGDLCLEANGDILTYVGTAAVRVFLLLPIAIWRREFRVGLCADCRGRYFLVL